MTHQHTLSQYSQSWDQLSNIKIEYKLGEIIESDIFTPNHNFIFVSEDRRRWDSLLKISITFTLRMY